MDKLIEKLKEYKLEHELPNENAGLYNVGYVKAINDAINLVKNISSNPPVIKSVCPRCKSDEDIRVKPITYDCMKCGHTWQTVL